MISPPHPAPPDAELVQRAIAGDNRAFDELMQRYSRILGGFVLARVSSRETAQDLVQESFLAAYSALPRLRDRARFGSWLLQIAHNKVCDHIRRRQRERLALAPGPAEDTDIARVPDAAATPDEVAVRCEFAGRVYDEIARLRPKLQDVVLLALLEELPATEIAARLGLKESTVRMRLMRGLARLRQRLERP